MDVLMSVLEVVFGLLGVWGLFKSMACLRGMVLAKSADDVRSLLAMQLVYALVSFVGLGLCVWIGMRPLEVFLFAAGIAFVAAMAGICATWLRVKSLRAKCESPADIARGELVVIRALHADRVRGVDSDERPVVFNDEQVSSLVGVRGRLRMLTWATGRRLGAGALAPVWVFWSHSGDQFLLYPDDDVTVVMA